MENKAFLREIRADFGSCVIGELEGGKRYRVSYDSDGDGTFRLWLKDKEGKTLHVVNRIGDILEDHYEYMLTPTVDCMLTYHTNGKSIISDFSIIEEE